MRKKKDSAARLAGARWGRCCGLLRAQRPGAAVRLGGWGALSGEQPGARAAAGPFGGVGASRRGGACAGTRCAGIQQHTLKGKYPGGRLKPLGSRGAVFAGGLRDGPPSGSLELNIDFSGSGSLGAFSREVFPHFSNERASRKARPGGESCNFGCSLAVPTWAHCKKIASCIAATAS